MPFFEFLGGRLVGLVGLVRCVQDAPKALFVIVSVQYWSMQKIFSLSQRVSNNKEIFMYIIKHRLQVCTIQSINPHSNEPIPDLLQCFVRCLKRVHARQKRARLCAIDSPRGKCYRLPSDPSIRPSIPIHIDLRWSFADSRMFLITHGCS